MADETTRSPTKHKVLTVSTRHFAPVLFPESSTENLFSSLVAPPNEAAADVICPRVLIVSSKVKSPSVVLSAAREDVVPILVAYETSTFDTVLKEVWSDETRSHMAARGHATRPSR